MKKGFLIANVLLMEILIMFNMVYSEIGGLWLKAICSTIFVVIGAVNLVYVILTKAKDLKFTITMVVALVIAMIGDIVLNINFVIGALIFAVGHVFYFIAYCMLEKFEVKNLIATACIFVPSALIILLYPNFDFGSAFMQILCLAYALIISFMVGKAITNAIKEFSVFRILVMIGSILFFFSDLMLLFNCFGTGGMLADILCLASYYPGQGLLAFTLFYNAIQPNKTEITKE